MGVLINNNQNKYLISKKKAQKVAEALLKALDLPDGELSILFVDDRQMAQLNRKYLNRKGPTNVIAFPMREGNFSDINPGLLGDVVISTETTSREATAAGISMEQRILQLLVHGILHLFGFDHETSAPDALLMEKKSRELLDLISAEFRDDPRGILRAGSK